MHGTMNCTGSRVRTLMKGNLVLVAMHTPGMLVRRSGSPGLKHSPQHFLL